MSETAFENRLRMMQEQLTNKDEHIRLLKQEVQVYRAGLKIMQEKLEEAIKILEPLTKVEGFDGLLTGTHSVVENLPRAKRKPVVVEPDLLYAHDCGCTMSMAVEDYECLERGHPKLHCTECNGRYPLAEFVWLFCGFAITAGGNNRM